LAHGGETSLANLTLLCSYHHRLLHEGGFGAQRNADGTLTFARVDGRVIPRAGYRVEDLTDDEVAAGPSREGYRPMMVQNPSTEVCELRTVYRVTSAAARFASLVR
jgi:hypothetical protein